MRFTNKSVLSLLVKCPLCGHRFLPGMEGKPDGSACYECEARTEEPRVTNWADPHRPEADV